MVGHGGEAAVDFEPVGIAAVAMEAQYQRNRFARMVRRRDMQPVLAGLPARDELFGLGPSRAAS